jgi:hypothetical protein
LIVQEGVLEREAEIYGKNVKIAEPVTYADPGIVDYPKLKRGRGTYSSGNFILIFNY